MENADPVSSAAGNPQLLRGLPLDAATTYRWVWSWTIPPVGDVVRLWKCIGLAADAFRLDLPISPRFTVERDLTQSRHLVSFVVKTIRLSGGMNTQQHVRPRGFMQSA